MRKLFELNEKDLEMISGGDISKTIKDIVESTVLGLPGGTAVLMTVEKIQGERISTSRIVASGITAVVSSVALMGLGAGVLKTGQVLYNRFKGKKSQANNLDKKAC